MDEHQSPQNPPNLIEIIYANRRLSFILDHLIMIEQVGNTLMLRFPHGEHMLLYDTEPPATKAYIFVLDVWRDFLRGRQH